MVVVDILLLLSVSGSDLQSEELGLKGEGRESGHKREGRAVKNSLCIAERAHSKKEGEEGVEGAWIVGKGRQDVQVGQVNGDGGVVGELEWPGTYLFGF